MLRRGPGRTRFLGPHGLLGIFAAFAALAWPVLAAAEATVCPGQTLTDRNPETRSQFGCSVSIDGDRLAVGANLDDTVGEDSGSVTPFLRADSGEWERLKELAPTDLQPGDQFGYSLSISGDTMAIGAPFGDSGRARNSGTVYVFRWNGSAWVQEGPKLTAADAARGDQFGIAVSLRGDSLLVGAPFDGDAGSLSGAVYVFSRSAGSWTQRKLVAPDARPFDNFGFTVALDGNTAVVGAPFADDPATRRNRGAVYVFQRNGGGVWDHGIKLPVPASIAADGQFGSAVAVRDDTIVVGARANGAGAVFVFQRTATGWQETQELVAGDARPGDFFGVGVSLGGNRLLVGARLHAAPESHSGVAYLFERPPEGARWQQRRELIGKTTDAGDQFGHAVSLSGEDLLIGAFLDEALGQQDAGSATVCEGQVQPKLLINKTHEVASVQRGETFSFSITATNGSADTVGAQVTDSKHADLQALSWQRHCEDDEGGPLSCLQSGSGDIADTVSLPPGAKAIYDFKVKVGQNATGKVTNEACVDAPGFDLSCKTDEVVVDSSPPGVLTIDKFLVPDRAVIHRGDPVTYRIEVSNDGPAAIRGTVTDELSATCLTGVRWCQGAGCTPSLSGDIEKTVDVPPGQATVTLTVTGTVPCTCGPVLVNEACVEASGQARVCDTDTRLVEDAPPSLRIDKTGSAAVRAGETAEYALKITNGGSCDAADVVVGDPTPAGLVFDSASSPCELGFPCHLGRVPPGMVVVTARYKVPCDHVCPDQVTNTASLAGLPAATSSVQTAVGCPLVDFSIFKDDGLITTTVPSHHVYTLTAKSDGLCDVAAATVTDKLPPALLDAHCVGANAADCKAAGGEIGIQADLPAQGEAVYRIEGDLELACAGELDNVVTISPPPNVVDPVAANDRAEDKTGVLPPPGILALCVGDCRVAFEGGTVTFTIVLFNGGPRAQADNPGDEFTDTLPAGLTLSGAAASSGTVLTAANTVTWNGPIAVCEKVTITIQATVDASTAGMTLCNQGTGSFDLDGDGINESSVPTDDPSLPGASDPCCVTILPASAIPALRETGLAALALLLAGLAVARLRARERRRGRCPDRG